MLLIKSKEIRFCEKSKNISIQVSYFAVSKTIYLTLTPKSSSLEISQRKDTHLLLFIISIFNAWFDEITQGTCPRDAQIEKD